MVRVRAPGMGPLRETWRRRVSQRVMKRALWEIMRVIGGAAAIAAKRRSIMMSKVWVLLLFQ